MDLGAISDWLFADERQAEVDDPKTVKRLLDQIQKQFGVSGAASWAELGDHLENENFHDLARGARARATQLGWVAPEVPPPRRAWWFTLSEYHRVRLGFLVSVAVAIGYALVFGWGRPLEPFLAVAAASTAGGTGWLLWTPSRWARVLTVLGLGALVLVILLGERPQSLVAGLPFFAFLAVVAVVYDPDRLRR